MVRDPFAEDEDPSLQAVLDALDDEACRDIIKAIEEPMTASEISNATDVPLSTTYRKLDQLDEASLLEAQTEIRDDGHHTTRYRHAFEAVLIGLDDDTEFEVTISRPARSPEERLATLWSEVREEA